MAAMARTRAFAQILSERPATLSDRDIRYRRPRPGRPTDQL